MPSTAEASPHDTRARARYLRDRAQVAVARAQALVAASAAIRLPLPPPPAEGRVVRSASRRRRGASYERSSHGPELQPTAPPPTARWASAAVLGERVIVDRPGVRWVVRELAASADAGCSVRPCLVFESDGVVRRVLRYPADWATLDAAALLRVGMEAP